MTKILGISAYYHDSAAALTIDGIPIFAAQEERYTRIKHDPTFPLNAIKACLDHAGLTLDDLDAIAFYEKPFLKFERLLETYLAHAPKGFMSFQKAIPVWIKDKLFQKNEIIKSLSRFTDNTSGIKDKLLFTEHHQSHAASSFYPSPFDEAIVLTMDGVGEWATTTVSHGTGNQLKILKEIHFPHSLGLLYSAFTYYCGFKVNSGEYKLMGLAPYGVPKYADLITDTIVKVAADGSFWLDPRFFNYATGLTMTSRRFHTLFGRGPRPVESGIDTFYMDMAASIQQVTETIMLRIVNDLAQTYDCPNLCLAGGVALNCVANGKIVRSAAFDNVWIQPAAGDAGGALGAALAAHYTHFDHPRVPLAQDQADHMSGSYLGPEHSQHDIEQALTREGAVFDVLSDTDLLDRCSTLIAAGRALGWFQGRMEYGPRALGNRSILADPRNPETQKTLNLKVKFRENFRPFAPSILLDHADDYFGLAYDSPYMLVVSDVQVSKRVERGNDGSYLTGLDRLKAERSIVPAVTHVDFSARVQTVHEATNPRYHALLTQFHETTGCPLLVNTSFNVRGEPIVNTPAEAYKCFMGTGMEALAIGNCLLEKSDQPQSGQTDYSHHYPLD